MSSAGMKAYYQEHLCARAERPEGTIRLHVNSWRCCKQVVSRPDLLKRIDPAQMRLASELFTILEAARFITRQQDCVYHTSSLASSPQTTAALQHLDEQRVALESSLAPHSASHAHLLWHSTRKLPDLLSGAVLSRAGRLGVMGMQILSFHGSSTAEGLKLTGLPLAVPFRDCGCARCDFSR